MTTNTPDWEGLGRELERLRKLTTISANEAGRRLGISGTQVRNFERALDKGRPSAGYLSALADLYGADPMPLLRLGGYPAQIVTTPTPSVVDTPSVVGHTLTVEDRGPGVNAGKYHVTVRIAALGTELVIDYDDPSERAQVVALAAQAARDLIEERGGDKRDDGVPLA